MAASTERKKDTYEMGFLLAPRVPQGLAAVVESLTREVLRQRPEDIYVFAARHFEKLLTLREQYDDVNIGVDKKKLNKECNNYSSSIKKRNDCKLSRKSKKRTTKDNIEGTRKVEKEKKEKKEEEEEGCCWSLNETARVLERHRNIFGEGDKRISTEEIRALAKEKKNLRTSSSTGKKMNKRGKMKSSENEREYTKDTMIKMINNDNDDSTSRLDRNKKTMKIISQIPTVLTRNTGKKDIKMELRKNRLRDKSTDSSNNEGQYQEQISDPSRKNSSSRKGERNASIEKLEDELIRKKQARRSDESIERYSSRSSRSEKRKNSLTEFPSDKKELLFEARNMDQVKEYVLRNFGSVENIDQMIDTSYVNQVQNVIDRNVPIIKDKIDELKYDVLTKKSKGTNANKDASKKREIRPNTSESDNNRSNEERDKHRSKRSSSVDSTMDLKRRQQLDDTLENRLINTKNILECISSKCYNKSSNYNYNRIKSNNGHCVDEQQQDNNNKCPTLLDGNSKIILPAVRPASSKNSKCLSRGDSNHLILPPISPDTAKISKKKDELTLPTLSTTTVDNSNGSVSSSSLRSEEKDNNYSVDNQNDNQNDDDDDDDSNLGDDILQLSTSIKDDITSTRQMLENVNEKFKTPVNCPIDDNKIIEEMSSTRNNVTENNEVNDKINDNLNDLLGEQIIKVDVHAEEIFQDSLNVTPDIIDIPPSPDSLEPIMDNRDLSTVNEQTEYQEKFFEIEEIKSNIENEDTVDKSNEMNNPEPVILEVSDDSIGIQNEEPVREEIVEIIKVSSDSNPKPESDDRSTGQMENDRSEINESKDEINNTKEIDATVDNEEIVKEQNNSLLSFEEKKSNDYPLNVSLSKEVPYSYILTEGSPVEIPDFVTTVIIPERSPSTPELNLDINEEEEEEEVEEEKDGEIREERRRRAVESFGEYIKPEQMECSTVDIDFIRGIKAGHEIAIIRQDLDGIKEEEEYDEEKQLKSMGDNEDEKNDDDDDDDDIKKDHHSPLLEHISETEENDNDDNDKCEKKMIPVLEIEMEIDNKIKEEPNGNVNLIENSLENEESTETVDVTSESTNEVKETTITDRSTDSLSLDPARPIVPELNLDSLRDITVSSFKMNDADETVSLTEPTLSGKDKVDLDENNLSKDDEHLDDNDRKENDDTSPIEMISIDDKPMETDGSLIRLDNEESNKDVSLILSEEKGTIKNEDELSNVSNIKNQSALIETIEQNDVSSPVGYLKIEEHTTDLDTEEEIAKELIEIDRAENLSHCQDTPIVSNDDSHRRRGLEDDKSNEIVTIVEEENIQSTNEKQEDNDSIRKNTISDSSIENLIEIVSSKDEEENISQRIESTRSNNDNEEVNGKTDGNVENNVRSDTSLTTFEEVEPKEHGTKLIDEKINLKTIESQEKEKEKEEEEEEEEEDDYSKSSSTTFHSAATKIQAGIRGFLTRKKLQENDPRGSTLDSIPSIQESVAEEPLVDDLQSVSEEVADSLIKSALSSAMTSENTTKVDEKEEIKLTEEIPTSMKHRQCLLRREDAIKRNTLSTENAFASCGVQHTGEFHDCLPLPVLESVEMTKSNVLSENKDNDERVEEELIDQNKSEQCTKEDNALVESSTDLTLESNERINDDNIENIDRTSPGSLEKDLNNLFGGLHPKDLAQLLVSQVNRPIMLGLVDIVSNSVMGTNPNVIFETNANLNVNEDLKRSVKDDSTLQNSYLNFITSVEDNEANHVIAESSKEYKDHSNEHSMQSLREPLALPGTPEGVLIEELSSLDSTTVSKLQDVSFNPINLESTTMDRESIEKSIDSGNSMELLDKSDDVDVQTPITAKRDENITLDDMPIIKENVKTEVSISTKEDEIENKEETVKDNADQLLVDENIHDTNGETIEQSTSSSGIEMIENNENKKEYSDDREENNEASS
ncbi:protein PFC0760c-like, partial [Polistes fuscatus]|uniref:protein PFC0760c-like n=1 Tax=Polistes fuscatus TaxID=30207 RepID=UPI001CA7B7C0